MFSSRISVVRPEQNSEIKSRTLRTGRKQNKTIRQKRSRATTEATRCRLQKVKMKEKKKTLSNHKCTYAKFVTLEENNNGKAMPIRTHRHT